MTITDVDRALGLVYDDLDDRAAETVIPPFSTIGRRRSRHQRRRLACSALALGAVAIGGVVVSTTSRSDGPAPGSISSVQVASPGETIGRTPSVLPSADPRLGPPSVPPASDPYVVVAAGNYLVWTDTRSGRRGHLPGTGDSKISFPAVSANGRHLVYLASTASSTSVAVLDLATQQETTMRVADVDALSAPSINAEGTIVSWAEQTSHASGIVEAPFAHQAGYTTVLPDVSSASFDRQGGLVYIPSGTRSCALDRRSPEGTTTCLLTATSRDAVTSPNGGVWIVADPHPSATSDRVAVTVLEASPGSRAPLEALAVVSAGALHVLVQSAVDSDHETVNQPDLRNQDAQLLYVNTDVPVEGQAGTGSVYAVSASDGAERTRISDGGATGFAYAGAAGNR